MTRLMALVTTLLAGAAVTQCCMQRWYWCVDAGIFLALLVVTVLISCNRHDDYIEKPFEYPDAVCVVCERRERTMNGHYLSGEVLLGFDRGRGDQTF